jgi:predicted alpha/beta hydrolase family esterase
MDMKKVIIVHGWDGAPTDEWYPWLRKELEARESEVIAPQLPNPSEPRIGCGYPLC